MSVSAFLLKIMAFDTADIQRNTRRLLKNIKGINKAARECMEENGMELLALNRDQMLYGRDNRGSLLAPEYMQDPYFDTPAKAKAYAEMKRRREAEHRSLITHQKLYPAKPSDTPNLRVTGALQDNMYVRVTGSGVEIASNWLHASEVSAKYKNRIFGLSPESKDAFWETTLCDHLERHLENGVQLY